MINWLLFSELNKQTTSGIINAICDDIVVRLVINSDNTNKAHDARVRPFDEATVQTCGVDA